MSEINEIGARFDKALSVLQVSNKEISELFDTSSQNVSNLKKADRLNDLMSRIAVKYNINLNWLMSGSGDMFITKSTQTNNLQNSTIAGNGVDNSKGSSHIFNNNHSSNSVNIPTYIIDELNVLFFRAAKKNKVNDVVIAFDDFVYEQKKSLRD